MTVQAWSSLRFSQRWSPKNISTFRFICLGSKQYTLVVSRLVVVWQDACVTVCPWTMGSSAVGCQRRLVLCKVFLTLSCEKICVVLHTADPGILCRFGKLQKYRTSMMLTLFDDFQEIPKDTRNQCFGRFRRFTGDIRKMLG